MTTKRYLTISSDGIETLWFDKPMKYYDGHGNFKWHHYEDSIETVKLPNGTIEKILGFTPKPWSLYYSEYSDGQRGVWRKLQEDEVRTRKTEL